MAAKKKPASKRAGSSRTTSAKAGKTKSGKAKAVMPKPGHRPASKPGARPAAKAAGKASARPASPATARASGKPGARPTPGAPTPATAKPVSRPAPPAAKPAPSARPAAKGDGREAAFRQLRAILVPYAKKLQLKRDLPDVYYLDAAYSEEWKRDVFFGAVRTTEAYVSFHLMPVYVFPELLKGMSPELKKRMQGKSCFNFVSPDKALFAELERLTAAGYDLFRKAGLA